MSEDDFNWDDFDFDGDVFFVEERGLERHPVSVGVTMVYYGQLYEAQLGDISEGGVFVSTTDVFPTGTELDLEFTLPTSRQPLCLRGEVRWTKESDTPSECGFGAKFIELSEAEHTQIVQFLELRSALLIDD